MKSRFAIKSMKTRMVVLFSLAFLVVTVGASAFFYFTASGLMRSNILREAQVIAELNAQAISRWFIAIEDDMYLFSQIPEVRAQNWDEARVLMNVLIEDRPYYGGILLANLDGDAITVEGHVINIGERDYFLGALAEEGVYYSQPMVTQATDLATIMLARAVYDQNGRPNGVVAFSVSLEELQAVSGGMSLHGLGYGWLINEELMVLGHPNSDYLGNADLFQAEPELRPIVSEMLMGEAGVDTYRLGDENAIVAYAPITQTGWAIALEAPEKEVMAGLTRMAQTAGGIIAVAVVVGSILAYVLANSMANPIIKLKEGAERIATGHLVEITGVERSDEIGALGAAFNQMVGHLRRVIENVTSSVGEVLDTSNSLSAATEQTSASIEEVASSANQFSSTVTSMNQNVVEVTNATTAITSMASDGETALAESTAKMDEMVNSIQQIADIVQSLDESSDKIELIVKTIFEITEQTNLLALNAAIEAARAGEQGRGFAVVAGEIRKLSEQSHNATQDIRDLISDIQSKTKQATAGVEMGVAEVHETATTVSHTAQLLSTIMQAINEVSERIERVKEDTLDIDRGAQEMAAATEEQSATVEQIASSAVRLTEMAAELRALVERFQLS